MSDRELQPVAIDDLTQEIASGVLRAASARDTRRDATGAEGMLPPVFAATFIVCGFVGPTNPGIAGIGALIGGLFHAPPPLPTPPGASPTASA